MSQVRLTQETCLKHFDRLTAARPQDWSGWPDEAIENHRERFGAGVLPSNINTLYILTDRAWERVLAGEYLFCNPMPQVLPAELELSIAADDIARVITTRKGDSSYSVVSDKTGAAISSPTFTCKLDPDQQNYSIVHLQTP